jgi:hypothetical protein
MVEQQAGYAQRDAGEGNPLRCRERADPPRVGPEHFHPEAAHCVPDQVQAEDITVPQPTGEAPAAEPQQAEP